MIRLYTRTFQGLLKSPTWDWLNADLMVIEVPVCDFVSEHTFRSLQTLVTRLARENERLLLVVSDSGVTEETPLS